MMNTKLIMTSTAVLLAAIGISLIFAPDHISVFLGIENSSIISLILQLIGAAYCAFAMLNWIAKGTKIGGIYNRPISVANLSHFLIGGITLMKAVLTNQLPVVLSIVAGFYIIIAFLFWLIMSHHV